MKFYIEQFYPSIDERLLLQALKFAKNYIEISAEDTKIILFIAKSILFNQRVIQIKSKINNTNPLYGITTGSKHGVEVCEIVGLQKFNKLNGII